MASGRITGGYYNTNTKIYSYALDWSSTPNNEANTSDVTLKWIYKKEKTDQYNAYNNSDSTKVTLVIAGNSSGAKVAHFDLRYASVGTESAIATYTVYNIPHNDDGTLSIYVSGSHATGLNWGTKSIGNTLITLDTIPRQSVRIRVNGEWKRAFPYIRVNGEWKKATAYIRANGEWKRGG